MILSSAERVASSFPFGQEAMEKVERYRERILILKEDRHAKKAMVSSCLYTHILMFFIRLDTITVISTPLLYPQYSTYEY